MLKKTFLKKIKNKMTSEHIAIISATTCILPLEDGYKKQLLLFGYANSGRSIMLKINHYNPYILVLPNQEDMEQYGNELYLNYVKINFNLEHKTNIQSVDVHRAMPVGFTGHRIDSLIKIFYNFENERFGIVKAINDTKQFGNIRLSQIIHSKVSVETQFLLEKGLHLQKWASIQNFHFLNHDLSFNENIAIDSFRNQIVPCQDKEQLNKILTPNLIILRTFAHSSLATRTNYLYPNAKLKEDVITHIAYQINHNGEPKCLTLSDFDNNERLMLEFFGVVLHSNNTHIVVFAADEIVLPNSLEYITMRASGLNADFSFSPIKGYKVMSKDLGNGRKDLQHPGMERINLIDVLKRAQINPPMVGYTMLEVVLHKNLINPKDEKVDLSSLRNRNFIPPTHFSASETDISSYLILNVVVMSRLFETGGYLQNILTISRENDLPIRKVVEFGQQKRVLGKIMRDFVENNLYLDEETMKKNPVTVPKPRAESSYPDPPWLESPDIMTFLPPEERETEKKPKNPLHALLLQQKKRDVKMVNHQLDVKKNQKKKEKKLSYGGGLVLDPFAFLYRHVRHTVATNDWKSMYPNLIIAYNLCVMREIRDSKWLTNPDVELEYIPRNDDKCDVLVKKYKGKDVITFTPRVIASFLALREIAREKVKSAKTKDEALKYKSIELALKGSANSVYGFFGCLTSDIVSIQFASCVTQLGQFMQKTVRYQIILHGGAVVYGDTDSCFTIYPVDFSITDPDEIRNSIRRQATQVTDLCSIMFDPSAIIVENLKNPLLLTKKKKTYISIEDGGKISAKGLGLLKRDKCQMAREITLILAEQVINGTVKSHQEVCKWLQSELNKIPMHNVIDMLDLSPFILTVELSVFNPDDTDKLGLELASLYEEETGQMPNIGDRMSYVVAFYNDERKHNKRVLPPMTFLKKKHRLDIKWYIEKQIYSCLKQILCLDMHTSLLQAIKTQVDLFVYRWKISTVKQTCNKFLKVERQHNPKINCF